MKSLLLIIVLFVMTLVMDLSAKTMSMFTYKRLQKVETLIADNEYKQAEGKLNEILKNLPESPVDKAYIFYTTGMFHLQRNHFKEAKQYLVSSYELDSFPEKTTLYVVQTLAGLSMQEESYDEAVVYYQNYLKLAKEPNKNIYLGLGTAYYYEKEYQKATAILQEAIPLFKPNESMYLMLFSSYYELEELDEALVTLKKMVQLWPKKQKYWMQLASLQYETRRLDEAITTLGKMVQLWPEKQDYWMQLTSIHLEREEYQISLKILRTALAHKKLQEKDRLEKRILNVLQTLGGLSMQEENYKDAISYYQEYLQRTTEPNKDVYLGLGTAYYYQKQYKQAITTLEKATKLLPPHEPIYQILFTSYYELKQLKQAIETMEKIVELWPKKQAYWLQLSSLYYEAQQMDQAIATLEKMVQRWPDKQEYWLQLSSIHIERLEYQKALKTLQQALAHKKLQKKDELKEQILYVLQVLAELRMEEKRFEEAIGYYEAYLKRAKKPNRDIYIGLGTAYYSHKAYKKAVTMLTKTVRQFQPEEAVYLMLFSSHYELKQWNWAIRTLETMIRLWPNQPEYWLHLSSTYIERQQYKKSLEILQAAWTKNYLVQEDDLLQYVYTLYELQLPYKAAIVMQEALEQNIVEANQENYEFLAKMYWEAKEREQAVEALEQASTYSTNGNNDLYLAQLYLEMEKDYEKVIEHAKRATEKGVEQEGNANLFIGAAYSELGQIEQAKQYLIKASKYQETQEESSQWLQSLQ